MATATVPSGSTATSLTMPSSVMGRLISGSITVASAARTWSTLGGPGWVAWLVGTVRAPAFCLDNALVGAPTGGRERYRSMLRAVGEPLGRRCVLPPCGPFGEPPRCGPSRSVTSLFVPPSGAARLLSRTELGVWRSFLRAHAHLTRVLEAE